MHPERAAPYGAIVVPAETPEAHNTFNVKGGSLSHMPIYYGRENECPYSHIRQLEEFVNPLTTTMNWEVACLKLFPNSLQDKAHRWYESLKPRSLTTWAAVRDIFYRKYFSDSKTQLLTQQIQ